MAFDLSRISSLLKKEVTVSPVRSGVVGIDIGSSAVKIVQIKDVKGIPTLETYGELQLGPYEGIDLGRTTHLPSSKLTEALIDILREAGATSTKVVFALSYNSSFTATIKIPTLEHEIISSMIPIEARKYIPISLTKVNLDWIPLAVHEEEKSTEVLVFAIYSEALARYESVMKGSNLDVQSNEIEIFSSIRSALSPKDEAVAIIDFGAQSTRMYIVRKGIVCRTHSVLLSGSELTQNIADILGIEFRNAEELKRSLGLHGKVDDPRIQKTLVSAIERGFRELHTVIKRYEEAEAITIEKISMCGSGSLLPGLSKYVEDMFSRSVQMADPFSKVAYPAFLEDTLKIAGPSFAIAVGVSLSAFQKKQ